MRTTNNNYEHASHAKYNLEYHLIWCPKFRYNVLNGNIEQSLKQSIEKIAKRYDYDIKAMEVMPDHVHLLIGAKPTVAPSDIARTIKSITAIDLFKQYPELKTFYARCGRLWSRGYFICSVGQANEEVVKRYIEDQKSK